MKKIYFTIIIYLISLSINAQITTSINQIFLNSQTTIMSCSTLDFGTTQNNNLVFYYKLTRPQSLPNGTGTLRIMLKLNSSSNPQMINSLNIADSSWGNIINESTIACNIGENQVQQTGSSVYLEFETTGNIKSNSCEYPITKTPTPTFTLSPTSTSIACNSSSPIAFTVTSTNIPVGATLTYNWSYSNWQGNNTNTNTITLTPNIGSLPSSVTVTPVLNGVNQPAITCSVSRADFSSIAAITGPTGVCSGTANYSISNIAAGQTVYWGLSNSSIGTLTNQSNTGVTVAFTGNGAQTLNVSIMNACGQITPKSFVINTGSTTFTSTASISGGVSSICSGTRIYTVNNVLAGQTVNWIVSDTNIATLSTSTGTQTTVNFIGSGTLSLSAVVSNSCGQTATRTIEVYSGFATSTGFTSTPSGRDFTSGAPIEVESYSLPILNLNDKIIASFAGLTSAQEGVPSNWEWQALNSKISISGSRNARTIMLVDYGITGVKVRTKNACGWSPWVETQFEIVEIPPIWSKQSNPNKTDEYTIFPNPSKDVVNIASISKSNFPQKEVKIYGELFDLLGISKTKIEIIDGKALFSVKELKKGIYILKIFINDKIETHQIAVE